MSTRGKRVPPAQFQIDEKQREAIEHVQGPMLVVAGAGTGKTTVLTQRVARLIHEGHARPDQILALTYTENAAREMRERVGKELKRTPEGLKPSTFHAYCNGIIARHGKPFEVLDDQDQWIFLRKRIRELDLKHFVRAANVSQFLKDLLCFVRRCQDELVGPEQYRAYVTRLERGELPIPRVARSRQAEALTQEEVLGRCREIANVFETVERMLRERNFGTFGHMILGAYEILRNNPTALEGERAGARFILVDEFQDANFAQMKVLELLTGAEKNIFAVGDPDQGIYHFRGASSAAFQMFLSRFPGARLVRLDKNQRSTTAILKCAYEVIQQNPPISGSLNGAGLRYQRTPLVSARDERAAAQGAPLPMVPVEVVIGKDKDVEASEIPATIKRRQREMRCEWSDFAVLYRLHGHRELIAAELARRGIPISIEGMDILSTPEIRDLLACLSAVSSTADSAALFRVAALPQFQMKGEELRRALKAAPADCTLATVLAGLPTGKRVLESIEQARALVEKADWKAGAAIEIVIRHFGFDPKNETLAALREFVRKWQGKGITETQRVGELLEYLELFPEAGGVITLESANNDKGVRLLTAHGAKGLEFPHVFVVRANSGSFPMGYKETLVEFPRELYDPSAMVEDDSKRLHEQEERRLFYVAMTRARDSLVLSADRGRGVDARPTGFLRGLVKDKSVAPWLSMRQAEPLQVDLFAQEEPPPANSIAAWLQMPPMLPLHAALSASAIETYETCPLQFKLERDWRIPREIPAALQYGKAMHTVLKHYYDSVRQGRPATEKELIELFRTALGETPIADPYQRELYEKQGGLQLRAFLVATSSQAPDVLHTEEGFSIRIGEATVNGRMDRIDRECGNSVAIVDYKTGKPQAQEDADESLQLSIYALAAQQNWGYKPERLVFYNLENNVAVETLRSGEELQAAADKVEKVARQIATGHFDAKPGFHCKFCPYQYLCPATEKHTYRAMPAAQSN